MSAVFGMSNMSRGALYYAPPEAVPCWEIISKSGENLQSTCAANGTACAGYTGGMGFLLFFGWDQFFQELPGLFPRLANGVFSSFPSRG